jgi:hypothetical protein
MEDAAVEQAVLVHLGTASRVIESVHSTTCSIFEAEVDHPGGRRVRVVVQRGGDRQVLGVFKRSEDKWEADEISRPERISHAAMSICLSEGKLGERVPEEQQVDDIALVMAVLSREQLELVLAKVCAEFPVAARELLDEARKPIQADQIRAELEEAIEVFEETGDDAGIVEGIVERANAYLLAKDVKNCQRILDLISEELVNQTEKSNGFQQNKNWYEKIFGVVENAWQGFFELITENQNMRVKEVKQVFKKVAEWRQRLVPSLGPIFSDPLRMLKIRIEKLKGDEQGNNQNQDDDSPALGKKVKAS